MTAATGLDANSHAVENFVSTAGNSISRDLSPRAWRLLSCNFLRVLDAPGDLETRSGMLLGASLAGAAIEHSMLGAAHRRRDLGHVEDIITRQGRRLDIAYLSWWSQRIAEATGKFEVSGTLERGLSEQGL